MHKTQVEFRSPFSGKSASYGPGNTVFINFLIIHILHLLYMVLVNGTVNISNVMSPNGRCHWRINREVCKTE